MLAATKAPSPLPRQYFRAHAGGRSASTSRTRRRVRDFILPTRWSKHGSGTPHYDAHGGSGGQTCRRVLLRSASKCFLRSGADSGLYERHDHRMRDMITGALIAEIAALVGEPARATMLSALLDGRALTASELAYAARVSPQTASTHLARLTEAGLLSPIRDGRHRYFRLASPKVVEMLDGIVAVALENRPRYRPLSRQARELSAARICYDHLAGRLGVDLADFLTTHEYIVLGEEATEITEAGTRFLAGFGIDLSSSTRRHFCRLCLDWTERRPHIHQSGGAGRQSASCFLHKFRWKRAEQGCQRFRRRR